MYSSGSPKFALPEILVLGSDVLNALEQSLPESAEARTQATERLLRGAYDHVQSGLRIASPYIYKSLNQVEDEIYRGNKLLCPDESPELNARRWRFGGKLGAIILQQYFNNQMPTFSDEVATHYDLPEDLSLKYAKGFGAYYANQGVIQRAGMLFRESAPEGAVEGDTLTVLPEVAAGYAIFLCGIADNYAFRKALDSSNSLSQDIEAFLRRQQGQEPTN